MPAPIGMNNVLGSPTGMAWGVNPDASAQGAYGIQADRNQAGYQRQRDASQFGYQKSLNDQQNAAQAAQQAAQLGFSREQLAQQGALTRQQIEASLEPTRFAESKFNQVFPFVKGQLGQALAGGGSGSFGYSGGTMPMRPAIQDSPVYTDQMIQSQVNSQRAMNDRSTATQQHALTQQMAGSGRGANSPLAAALGNNLAMNNLSTNTANEQDLRWKAAQGNASQVLAAQQARSAQDLGYLGEETKRGIAGKQQQTALLSALLGSM